MANETNTAILTSTGSYTFFTFRGTRLKFRTSPALRKYVNVKHWDHCYLVVDADYTTLGITEEYIDITEVLNDLYINADSFLQPIEEVRIQYD